MIYKIKRDKDGGFEVVPSASRKPVLIGILLAFMALCWYGLPYVILYSASVFGFRAVLKQITDNTLIAYYAALKESIVCSQLVEGDKTVLKRSERHRHLLEKAENELFKIGYLTVKEVYFKEQNVIESWTNYLLRVENVRNKANQDLLNDVKHDVQWCKKWLYNQI
jgi:hypothetical protein